MPSKLAEAYVEIRGKTISLDGGLANLQRTLPGKVQSAFAGVYAAQSKFASNFVRKFSGIGTAAGSALAMGISGAAAAAAAGAGAALLGGGALAALTTKLASDAAEVQGKFQAVFKHLTPQAEAFAKTFASQVGRSVVDVKSQAAGLQDLFVPLGFAREQAMAMSQAVVKLGADLASFNNVSDSDAIQRLTSGLLGEAEPMKKFGVILNEAAVKAQLLTMGIKGGADAATEQQKAMARLQIIMAATKDAQGDAIRTSGGFANQSKALAGSLKDMGVEIGQLFLPAATAMIKKFREMSDWLKSHMGKFKEWGLTIGRITGNVLESVSKVAQKVAEFFGKKFEIPSWGDIQKYATAWLATLEALTGNWKRSWDIIKTYTALKLIEVADEWNRTFDTIRAIAAAGWESVKAGVVALGGQLKYIFDGIKDSWVGLFKGIGDGISAAINKKNPFAAFSNAFTKELAKPTAEIPSIAKAMAEAWEKNYRVNTKLDNESVDTKNLRAELDRLIGDFDNDVRKKIAEAQSAANQAAPPFSPDAPQPEADKPEKESREKAGGKEQDGAEFTSLIDFWKRTQAALFGVNKPEIELAKQTLGIEKRQLEELTDLNKTAAGGKVMGGAGGVGGGIGGPAGGGKGVAGAGAGGVAPAPPVPRPGPGFGGGGFGGGMPAAPALPQPGGAAALPAGPAALPPAATIESERPPTTVTERRDAGRAAERARRQAINDRTERHRAASNSRRARIPPEGTRFGEPLRNRCGEQPFHRTA